MRSGGLSETRAALIAARSHCQSARPGARLLGLPGVRLAPLTEAAAISSSFLDEPFHGDLADRLLVASARSLPAALITRDARILSWAAAGHLRALAC